MSAAKWALISCVIFFLLVIAYSTFWTPQHQVDVQSSSSNRHGGGSTIIIKTPATSPLSSPMHGPDNKSDCAKEFTYPQLDVFRQVREHGGGITPLLFLREALLGLTDVVSNENKKMIINGGGHNDDGQHDQKRNDHDDNNNSNNIDDFVAERLEKERHDLANMADMGHPNARPGHLEEPPLPNTRVWIWAIDGTLLNLMRWAAIVNDNDVDLSFLVLPTALIRSQKDFRDDERMRQVVKIIKSVVANRQELRRWYVTLLHALAASDVIEKPNGRILKNLRQPFKAVKPKRCHIRRHGLMQCRHENGVMMDFFGPENSFVGRSGFFGGGGGDAATTKKRQEEDEQEAAVETLSDFFPLVQCKAYDATFPCPRSALKVLKSFTLDYSSMSQRGSDDLKKGNNINHQRHKRQNNGNHNKDGASSSSPPSPSWNEFAGCALFTKRESEHDRSHVASIVESARRIHDCGFPSLWEDREAVECKRILRVL